MTPVRDREAMDQAIVRGSDQLKQGKLDQAQRSFREALAIDPANTKVLALLGLTYFRGNQFGEARPIYEQLVERAPTDASHRLNLGLVYLKLGDGERAIAALEASRALDPSQGRAISYLGLAYARAGRYAEAYRAFLLAGQDELAREIELNLTVTEREQIQAQLGRAPGEPMPARSGTPTTPAPRATPPASTPTASTPPPVATPVATSTEPSEPRRVAHTIPRSDSKPNLAAKAEVAVRAAEASNRSLRPTVPNPMSESQMFVLPLRDPAAPQAPQPGQSMVSMAVAAAAPATPPPMRTITGGTPPRPLSELATEELVRPEDGDETFELAAGGALVMRVADRVMTRLDGVHVTGGDLAYEPATRRSRGHQTEERFDYGATPLYVVSGSGYLVAAPGEHTFAAVALDDDILYLREDLVFAFESSLRWENGNVPGLRGKLPIVQFRGDGALVIRTPRPLVRVKLPTAGVLLVDAERIAGWIGRVIPRAVVAAVDGPLGTMCIECTGEGIVLVEPAPPRPPAVTAVATVVREARTSPPPPPPPAPAAETFAEAALASPPEAGEVPEVGALGEFGEGIERGEVGPRDASDAGAALDPESAIDRLDEL